MQKLGGIDAVRVVGGVHVARDGQVELHGPIPGMGTSPHTAQAVSTVMISYD